MGELGSHPPIPRLPALHPASSSTHQGLGAATPQASLPTWYECAGESVGPAREAPV